MANKVILGVLAILPTALALGSVLNLTTPAQAFEVEHTRGSNKASRIVRTDKTAAPTVKVEPQVSTRRSPIFVRGNHGAQKIVPQGGV